MKNPRNKIALVLGSLLAIGGLTLTGALDSTPASAEQKVVAHGLRLPDGTRLPADAVSVAFDRLSGPKSGGGSTGSGHSAKPSEHGTPRVTGTAKAGATVGVVPQSFKNLPGKTAEVVTWYVDGKAVGHATKLKLKGTWKTHKLQVEVERTWTTKVKRHGRTVTQHHTLGAKSKAVKIH